MTVYLPPILAAASVCSDGKSYPGKACSVVCGSSYFLNKQQETIKNKSHLMLVDEGVEGVLCHAGSPVIAFVPIHDG